MAAAGGADMEQQGVCRIVGAAAGFGAFAPVTSRAAEDLLIAADGGLVTLQQMGLAPDVVLGDFDSLGRVPTGENVLTHPVEKDDTDMMLAVRLGLRRGYRRFYLYGGVGGRLDHTLANIQALAFLAGQGAVGFLFGEGQTLTVLKGPAAAHFDGCAVDETTDLVSAFAMGGAAVGVTLRGLHYPLQDYTLTPDVPLGVSNHRTAAPALVQLRQGMLLLVWAAPTLPKIVCTADLT